MKDYNIERNISFGVLSEDAKEKINEAALVILEKIGMKVSGEKTLAKLAERGVTPDEKGVCLFPRELVKWALENIPKELTLYDQDKTPRMVINSKNNVYFGTHADQLEIVDYQTNKARPFLKKDTELMCKLANNLDNIDFILSVGMSADIPPSVQSQVTFIETVKYFNKVINFSTNDIESLQEIIDIAALVAGGKEELAAKPFVFNYCEPIPPLTHPVESTEKLRISAENMIPVVYMPYCMMGGTSPLSKATTLAQCYAEILTGIVISQVSKAGAPFIIGSMPSIFDMRTTIGSYAAPEFHLNIAASAEMADYYGLPFYGTASCSDAKTVDPQSAAEASYEIFSTMLSKANIVHDVGVMDHCNSVSPVLAVIADELIEAFKHYNRGVTVNDETLNLDLITDVGHGGHYLNEEHTLDNFREVWYPSIFSRKMTNPDESEIIPDIQKKIEAIMEKEKGSSLDPDLLAKLNEIEEKYLKNAK